MADLQTIIRISQDELKKQLAPSEAMQQALGALSPREQEVVRRRHALNGQPAETLQEIGQEFGITRERIRQLEQQGCKKLSAALRKRPLADLAGLAVGLIRESGGLISQQSLFALFLPESQRTASGQAALEFLLELHPDVVFSKAERAYQAHYSLSEAHHKALQTIQPALRAALEKATQPIGVAELQAGVTADPVAVGLSYLLSETFIHSALDVSTAFVSVPDGKWGLATWSNINPRNIREKTKYTLKESGRPLHFSEITIQIRDAKFDQKRVTTQAVHNELINGEDFVLIGRGIYALKDWGYVAGTVADVIRNVLTEAQTALDREEIITRVLKQRQVSRNTILINLQEKNRFKRVAKHQYTLPE